MENTTPDSTISSRNEVKLAVMSEKITNIESNVTDIKKGIADLSTTLDGNYAKKGDVLEVEKRVSQVENAMSWTVKIVLGAVILAVLGLVLIHH